MSAHEAECKLEQEEASAENSHVADHSHGLKLPCSWVSDSGKPHCECWISKQYKAPSEKANGDQNEHNARLKGLHFYVPPRAENTATNIKAAKAVRLP